MNSSPQPRASTSALQVRRSRLKLYMTQYCNIRKTRALTYDVSVKAHLGWIVLRQAWVGLCYKPQSLTIVFWMIFKYLFSNDAVIGFNTNFLKNLSTRTYKIILSIRTKKFRVEDGRPFLNFWGFSALVVLRLHENYGI